MRKFILMASAICSCAITMAQVTNTGVMDTTDVQKEGKVTVGGYVDAYYGFDFNEPKSGDRSYFVSMARHNEFTINLAYADIKYSSQNIRARFVPGFGTYINANYAAEPGVLKNIVEGYAGIRLSQKREVWLDAGVFGSPYTNESAISKDHLMYTRSFAPEYVPYYLSGLKLSYTLNSKVNLYLYLLNGWQQIQDLNSDKSIGTQVEYRPAKKWLINWNTYVGNELSAATPQNRARYFTDVFFIYNPDGKFSATGCAYFGVQQRRDLAGKKVNHNWWQANLIGRLRFGKASSVAARVEYFNDPNSVQITPVTAATGFSSFSASAGYNYQIAHNIMVRLEGRTFWSDEKVYIRNGSAVNTSNLLISNLTLWF
ncbi:MAG: porin [Bacteroidota bacterium]